MGIFNELRMTKEIRSKYKTVCKFDVTNPSNYKDNKKNKEQDKVLAKTLLCEIMKEYKKFKITLKS